MINLILALKEIKCSSFVTIKDYHSQNGKSADYNIIINVNYEDAVKRSIKKLKEMKLSSKEDIKNRNELLDSLQNYKRNTKSNRFKFTDDNGNLIKSVEYNLNTKELYLIGYVVHKKCNDSSNKQLSSKERMRNSLPIGKFRQFKISDAKNNFQYITVNGKKYFNKES